MKILIDENGSVFFVHSDTVGNNLINNLGTPNIARASNVEFDNEKMVWRAVQCGTGVVIAEGSDRADVIQKEIAFLNANLNEAYNVHKNQIHSSS